MARLKDQEIIADIALAPAPADPACTIDAPVKLRSLQSGDRVIQFPDAPLLACGFVEKFSSFITELAAPLLQAERGSPITSLSTGPGFECRGRNRVASAKISAHGQGLAVDIRSLQLLDGRRLIVGGVPGSDRQLITTLQRAACGFFSTVLGPGSDDMHKDHLHFDMEPRSSRGGGHFCQP